MKRQLAKHEARKLDRIVESADVRARSDAEKLGSKA